MIVRQGTYDGPIFGWDSPPCKGDPLCVVAGTAAHPILFEADPTAPAGSVVIAAKNGQNDSGFDLEPSCDYVDIVGFTVNNAGTAGTPAGSIKKAGIAVSGCTGNRIMNNTVDGVSGIGGILVDTVNGVVVQGNTLTNTSSADTSTGNIAFNNVLLGGAGATSTVSGADLSTSKNITTAMAGLFVNSGSGNYTLAAGGPGIGAGIMTFGGAQAPSAGNGTYDIGAFSFAP